jgi:hypothetical protein
MMSQKTHALIGRQTIRSVIAAMRHIDHRLACQGPTLAQTIPPACHTSAPDANDFYSFAGIIVPQGGAE